MIKKVFSKTFSKIFFTIFFKTFWEIFIAGQALNEAPKTSFPL